MRSTYRRLSTSTATMATVQILRSWWRVRYPLYVLGLLVGMVMMWLPFKTFQDNDAWESRLRVDGVPAQAVVDELVHKRRNTMHVRYEFGGAQRQAEVGCWEVCLPAGSAVPIWVNPNDPGDLVTDFGILSGHRGRLQGVVGAAGLTLSGVDGARRDRPPLPATTRPPTRRRAAAATGPAPTTVPERQARDKAQAEPATAEPGLAPTPAKESDSDVEAELGRHSHDLPRPGRIGVRGWHSRPLSSRGCPASSTLRAVVDPVSGTATASV